MSLAIAMAIALVGSSAALANAQTTLSETTSGRIEFDYADGPEAVVEVDLGKGMLADASGLVEAALTGIVEGMLESVEGEEAIAIVQSADYVKSVQHIIRTVGGAVSEVRVRGYDRLTDEENNNERTALIAHYQKSVKAANWDDLIRVKDRNESAIVSVLREDGAIRGLFIMGSEGNNLVLVNVICDLSPEKVKDVSKQLAQLGMKFGLKQELEKAMREIHREKK